jgi:acyl-coenzyme A synthetase/AMP-(fatty) acid ligase
MIVERIYEWAKRQPDKTAVIWNDVSLSYLMFSNAILATCDFFQRENLPIGRTAIVLVSDLLDTWIIVMALRSLGLNTISVRSIDQAEALRINDVACIIVTQTEAAAAHNLAAKATSSVKVIAIPTPFYSNNDTNELLVVQRRLCPFGGHILYTSGTTGTYRKIMMSGEHENRRNHARTQIFSLDSRTIYHGTQFAPWTGMGFKVPSATWYAGGCVVFDARKDVYKNFFSHGVTYAFLIPGMLKELLQALGPLARPVDGFVLDIGGGSFPIDLAEHSVQKLTDTLFAAYGSTELISIPLRSRFRTKDDLLWLMPTDEKLIQVVDEDGKECPIDQEGELRILLSDIDCHHYLDDEEASARVFRDGFFYPGDMAVRREDGRIRILGRTADVVILNGEKVAAAPIEQAIQRYLQVDEVCLFSGLSEQGHEQLIVTIQSNRPIKRSQLEAVVPKFNIGKVRFSIWQGFPRSETGMRKTNRALLKKLVFEEINADER